MGKAEGTYRSNLGYLICFVWLWERPRAVLKENVGVHGIMQTAVTRRISNGLTLLQPLLQLS